MALNVSNRLLLPEEILDFCRSYLIGMKCTLIRGQLIVDPIKTKKPLQTEGLQIIFCWQPGCLALNK
jgi:hypothetical protein